MINKLTMLVVAATLCTLLITATWLQLWAQFDANQDLLSLNTVGLVLWPVNIIGLWLVVYRQHKFLKMRSSFTAEFD